MRPHRFNRLWFLSIPLLLAVALAFAACGDEEEDVGDGDGNGAPVVDVSNVPELQDGLLTVGSDIAYAPMEFFQPGTQTPDGFSVDLANALAAVMGVRAEFVNIAFDALIPSLDAGDFDVIISSMTITEERQQQIDFVPYLNVGTGILVPAGNPNNVQDLDDLCGLTVAVQVGTIQEQMANEIDCPAGQSVNVVTFDLNPLAVEDVRTGGSDANLADFPVVLFDALESDGALEPVETQVDPEPYGIGVRKGSPQLRQALEQAMQAIKDSGKYDEIIEKWNLESARLD
jgi:polar amino acid transport system substrate-binding protein